MYIHANAVNSALRGRFLSRVPWPLVVLLLLALGLGLGALYSRLSLGRAAVVALAALLGVAVLDYGLFVLGDIDLPPLGALLVPPLAWGAVENAWRREAEHRARERAKELDVARSIQQHLLPGGAARVRRARRVRAAICRPTRSAATTSTGWRWTTTRSRWWWATSAVTASRPRS